MTRQQTDLKSQKTGGSSATGAAGGQTFRLGPLTFLLFGRLSAPTPARVLHLQTGAKARGCLLSLLFRFTCRPPLQELISGSRDKTQPCRQQRREVDAKEQ